MSSKNNHGNKFGKLEWETRTIIGKLRRGSSETRKSQLECLGCISRTMQHYGLNSIRHLKPKHIERFFAEMRVEKLSAGRMANYASAMRMICRVIGKMDIMPSNAALGCARNLENRTKHADLRLNLDKANEVRSKLSEPNLIAYDMARVFNLRQKESLLSHSLIRRDGVDYLQVKGTKGGRPREIALTTSEQREVLQRNADYRSKHNGSLIDMGKSLPQGLKKLQNELAKAGATKASGANMHALRREWIIERCEKIIEAPENARQELLDKVVAEIGHGRDEVIRAYTRILG